MTKMLWWAKLLAWGLLIVVIMLLIPHASATHVCGSSGVCDGKASATATVGAAGFRSFCLQEVSVVDTCTPSTITFAGPWETNAGGTLTLEYRTGTTGVLPPGAPTTVQLIVRLDNTGTAFCTLSTGTPPPDGTTYTFHARTGCAAGGSPVAGTFRLYVRAVLGGVGGYDVTSDGNGPTNQGAFAKGVVRSRMVVSALDDDGAPGGGIYAYGPAATENVGLTAAFTPPAYEGNNEIVRLDLITSGSGSVLVAGTPTEEDDGVHTQQFGVTSANFPASGGLYGARFVLGGNAVLTGDPWTVYAATGHASGLVRVSDLVIQRQDTLNADPRVTVGSPSCVNLLINRGENGDCTAAVNNARAQPVTRSVSMQYLDSLAAVKTTQPIAGASKHLVYSVLAGDDASNDAAGKQWTIRAGPSDTYASASMNVFRVSSLYYCDAHAQRLAGLVKDDFPNDDDTEDFEYIISAHTLYSFAHVVGVRLDGTEIDTTGGAVNLLIIDPNSATAYSVFVDTGSDGWTAANLFVPSAPAGMYQHRVVVAFVGNSCIDEDDITVLSAYTANLTIQLWFNGTGSVGNVTEIFAFTRISGAAAEADGPLMIEIARVNFSMRPWAWEIILPATPMFNVVDYTASVNGPLWQYNHTWTQNGTYNIQVRGPLQGAEIRQSNTIMQVFDMQPTIGLAQNLNLITAWDEWVPFLVLFSLLVFFQVMGEVRKDNLYRSFAGVLSLLAMFTDIPQTWKMILAFNAGYLFAMWLIQRSVRGQ